VAGDAKAAVIHLSGVFPEQCGAFVKKVSVLSADAYFSAAFRRGYGQLGGKVEGTIRPGQVAAQARFLGAIPSDPLMQILRETNKNSNNLMARQLFLTLGAVLTGKPPSPSDSVRAIRAWITKRVPDTSSFIVENGSGLSDQERVTAKGMVSLLDYIRTSRFAAQFLDTLPAVGEDGTMRQRLREQPVAGRSVAKTGTLRDTRAIAGIVVSKHGRSYIFCMIVNHPRASASLGTIDKLIARLHSMPPSGTGWTAVSRQ
jgi:D-alanyl-D-alanine carboxypeptidase/D-alanyl-D-alanine-endopeptidase (penicillin-binding protein 4)